ncbi:hypothetical protein F2Q70_00025591 [Brassica cretica]|uniref:Uncharacterized protein n=1 Tax=Brassica cretica TaxID=69181 RepID=A0A8S9LCT5_BRACR|nr:hypothetical protein F2Q68_00025003 [Brassica cretica]KAF2603979.1 hypothetical protein F2Q70_00025591 [Brassica cretica]
MRYEFSPEFTSYEIQELYPRRYLTHGSKEARKVVAQEGQRVLPKEDNFQPNQGHAIVHFLDQKSDIPKAMKMSKNVGQNTLIRSKGKQEQAIVQVKAKVLKNLHPTEMTPRENLLMDQKDKQSKLFKEAKPITKVSNQGIPYESHMLTELTRADPEHELNQNPHHKWKPKSEQRIVQVPKPEETKVGTSQIKNKKFLRPELTLRISQKEHENRAGVSKEGCKEESFKEIPSDNLLLLGESTPKMYIQFRGRNFIKGQGMMRSSNQQLDQSVTKPSKPATMEIPATEVQYKENISTTRRFPNPSSCEYQPLEVDFSPTMKRPSPESNMSFKFNVVYFQCVHTIYLQGKSSSAYGKGATAIFFIKAIQRHIMKTS